MNRRMLKPIIGGVLLGAFVFFTGPLLLIVLLLKFIFTPFGMGRMMMYQRYRGPWGYAPGMRFAMADKIRTMSDEEFNAFKEKANRYNSGCQHHNHY